MGLRTRGKVHWWQAAITPAGLQTCPVWLGPKTPSSAVALGPQGPIQLSWPTAGRPTAVADTPIDFTPTTIAE